MTNASSRAEGLESLLETTADEVHERSKVLDAALSAFLDFGFRRASMSDIAKRSGISPATLYRRFPQKDEIVKAVALREVRRLLAEIDATIDRSAPAEEQLADLALTVLRTARGHPLLRRLLATEPDFVLPLLTVDAAPALELGRLYLVRFFETLQNDDLIPRFDPRPVSEFLARVALSMVLTPQTSLPLDDDDAVRTMAREHAAWMLRAELPPERRRRRGSTKRP